jgi:hypothetical protein
MKEILPFLLILACPLMMVFMMRGMHGGGHNHADRGRHEEETSAAELRRLRDEIDQRLQALDERVGDVEASTGARYDDALRT